MLIDLLKPAGPELARRWLAALMLVPEADRERVIEEVEKQIALEYGPDSNSNNGPADSGTTSD